METGLTPEERKKRIADDFYSAIEEYNNTIKKPHLLTISDVERRGILYNCFRRNLRTIKVPRITDVIASFREDGTIESVNIHNLGGSRYIWEEDEDSDSVVLGELLKKVSVLYPTKAMNEIASIVNSIK